MAMGEWATLWTTEGDEVLLYIDSLINGVVA